MNNTKFQKGKVYKTVGGWPAKILWVTKDWFVWAVHDPYTDDERVVFHYPDGKVPYDTNLAAIDKSNWSLTEEEYVQDFSKVNP